MYRKIPYIIIFGGLLGAALIVFGVIPLPKAKKTEKAPLKVLFIYAGPVSDGGWTQSHETIRQQIERSGGNVKADYAESVSSTEELKKVLSESKIKNYRVIVATSASFERETVQAAKKNPDKIFLQCSGRTLAPNLGTYFGKIYEARFLTGLIAGKMTKTNKIGFVGAYPVPEVLCGINAFALGVKKANPKANVYAAFTYSWFAPSQEREKAEQLIDAGCDLLTLHQDSPAVLQTAGEFGKNGIGYNSDMSIFAPGNHLTAPVWNWGVYYNRSFDEISDNTWKPGHYVGDLKDGLVGLAPFSKKVPAAVRKLAEDYEIKIKDGTINVFDGPVKDNKGKIRIKLGEKPDEKQIEKMDYLVEGVREIEKRK